MASYSVAIGETAASDLLTVPFPFRRQINQRIMKLKTNPRPPAAELVVEKNERHALDVAGWRILYEIDDEARLVRIVNIDKAPS